MYKIRLRYGQLNNGKYLGHLEVARAVERALRRTGLDLVVTEGYSPRLKMAFGPPLPVGYESETEIVEFFTLLQPELREWMPLLLRSFPEVLQPLELKEASPDSRSLMAAVDSARYEMMISLSEAKKVTVLKAVEHFKGGTVLLYSFRQHELELRFDTDVRQIEVFDGGEGVLRFEINCLTRGNRNIRPDILFKSLISGKIATDCIKIIRVVRKELYFEQVGKMKNLMELV